MVVSRGWLSPGLAVCLAVAAFGASRQSAAARNMAPADVTLEVTARRFEFVPDRLEVTEGDRVTIVLQSADTTHGFELKKLRISEEIPRGGKRISVTFTAPSAGTYDMTCSEYCGRGHDRMRGTLVVKPRPQGEAQ